MDLLTSIHRVGVRGWPLAPLSLLLGALAYYLAARLGMAIFSLQPSNISLLWLPAGVGLVMCRLAGWRALPFIFIASFAANAPGLALGSLAHQLLHTAISAAADTLSSALAALMLRRYLADGLQRLGQLFLFILYVCLLPTLLCAVLLAINLIIGGYIPPASGGSFVIMLIFADSLGVLLIYPLFEAWRRNGANWRAEWRPGLVVSLLALALVYLAFHQLAGLIFLLMPLLLYLVFEGHERAGYLALALSLCLVATLASHDFGPFMLADSGQSHVLLLSFLFTTTVVVLGTTLQQRDLLSEIKERQDWQYRANQDALTGLGNRRFFMPLLANEIERSRRTGRPLVVAVVDVDHFKLINDSWGHAVGDRILVEVAARLAEALRTVDVAARIGGEEFAILLPETSLEDARRALERVRQVIEQGRFVTGDLLVPVTISAGLACWQAQQPEAVEALLERADQHLYQAKNGGRNLVVAA